MVAAVLEYLAMVLGLSYRPLQSMQIVAPSNTPVSSEY